MKKFIFTTKILIFFCFKVLGQISSDSLGEYYLNKYYKGINDDLGIVSYDYLDSAIKYKNPEAIYIKGARLALSQVSFEDAYYGKKMLYSSLKRGVVDANRILAYCHFYQIPNIDSFVYYLCQGDSLGDYFATIDLGSFYCDGKPYFSGRLYPFFKSYADFDLSIQYLTRVINDYSVVEAKILLSELYIYKKKDEESMKKAKILLLESFNDENLHDTDYVRTLLVNHFGYDPKK